MEQQLPQLVVGFPRKLHSACRRAVLQGQRQVVHCFLVQKKTFGRMGCVVGCASGPCPVLVAAGTQESTLQKGVVDKTLALFTALALLVRVKKMAGKQLAPATVQELKNDWQCLKLLYKENSKP